MDDAVKKVIARLCHEGLLFSNTIESKRTRVVFADFLTAGLVEPRVFAILPAILKNKPHIIYKLGRDRHKYAKEIKQALAILNPTTKQKNYRGIEKQECQKIAQNFVQNLNHKRRQQNSITVTFRLKPEDLNRLRLINRKLNLNGISQTIRYLSVKFTDVS